MTPAQQELVTAHIPFALRIAGRYARRCPRAADDFEGSALLGLVRAARRFDPARGVPFKAYAGQRIKGEIRDHCRLTYPRRAARGVRAYEAHDPDWWFALPDPAPPPGDDPDELAADGVDDLTRNLPLRHRVVLRLRYKRPWATTAEIAASLGIRPQTVSRVTRQAYAQIWQRLTGKEEPV